VEEKEERLSVDYDGGTICNDDCTPLLFHISRPPLPPPRCGDELRVCRGSLSKWERRHTKRGEAIFNQA
jgi:hypothetical protein